jgi:amino acid permease
MKEPEKFPKVLTGSMIFMTVLFTSVGVVSYLAFGDKVETVILLNLPAHSAVVNSVQLLYAMAICLSIPLQLFPAIRIMETGLFTLSGKTNMKVKWQKNMFRFGMVVVCAIIAIGGSNVSISYSRQRSTLMGLTQRFLIPNRSRISINSSLSLVQRVVYPLASYSLLYSI